MAYGLVGRPCWSPKADIRSVEEEAGDRSRTGDLQLGKLTLYQLSYARNERNGAGGTRTPDFCDVNAAL